MADNSIFPKMLAVDDDDISLILIQRIFAKNFNVDIAYDGQMALEKAKENQYDIILMDVSMVGDINGTKALKILKSEKDYSDIPIIAVTAHAMSGDKEKILAEGFDDYISKPYDISILKNLVFKHLQTLV